MAPPERGLFEVVNKSKHEKEIIAVIAGSSVADIALKKRSDVKGHMAALKGGVIPNQTVINGAFGEELEVLEVACFHGCKVGDVEDLSRYEGDLADAFRHVKAYRIPCQGKNVLLKFKDGSTGVAGLELQRGESSSVPFVGKKKRSLGGGINMKTNAEMLEMVYK